MLAFSEYLSEFYEVEIFCLGPKNETSTWTDHVMVHYSPSNQLFEKIQSSQTDGPLKHKLKTALRIVLSKVIKNPLAKWQRLSREKLIQTHNSNPFDIVISSFAPQEAHLVALDFSKKFPTIQWIADMRDEMSKNPGLNAQQQANMRSIEAEINTYAKAITSVSSPILNDFKMLCPKVPFYEEIRNGYNHSFVNIQREYKRNQVFTMGYFGKFYGKRKPTIFLEALRQLMHEIPEFDFKWEIYGAHHNFDIPTELKDKVIINASLNYIDAIKKMAEMDINVQIDPRSERKGVFTGKIFDYISVQRPVLALVDSEDVAAQLVREFNCGYVAECTDIQENKQMILEAFNDWKNDRIKFASDSQTLSLHRKNQVYKLRDLIELILKA